MVGRSRSSRNKDGTSDDDTGRGHRRKKSVTSGISTLFRRSATPTVDHDLVDATAPPPNSNRSSHAAVPNQRPDPPSADPPGAFLFDMPESLQSSNTSRGRGRQPRSPRADGFARSQPQHEPPNLVASVSYEDGADVSDDGVDGRRGRSRSRSRSRTRRKSPMSVPRVSPRQLRLPRRFRGFSTSISALFLDETIVCGALSCFGLLLSARTEHLLNGRNVKRGLTRRGGKEGGRRAPSRILWYAHVLTILGVLATYAIWGFGDQEDAYDEWYDWSGDQEGGWQQGDDDAQDQQAYEDDAAAAAQDDAAANDDAANRVLRSVTGEAPPRHRFSGVMKLRDSREYVFEPAVSFATKTYSSMMSQFRDDIEFAPRSHRQRVLDEESGDPSSMEQDLGTQARTALIVLFMFVLGVIGRRRRMRTRFAILRSRAQDDHLYYASLLTSGTGGSLVTPDNTVMENFHEREDKYDGACSHTLCGCYPVDSQVARRDHDGSMSLADDETATIDTNGAAPKKRRKGGDFLSRAHTTLMACCCGTLCRCWCQAFSICALAQEAREARLLLPPSMQRIDYFTHQPFHEYAKDVNNLRRRYMERASGTWRSHWGALSLLSRYILLGFVLITAFVVVTLIVHPMGGFDWGDAFVLIATFTQSFVVLFVVFGIYHKSDLSFDAVVKFFAVGFCICVPVGFVLEGILVNAFLGVLYLAYWLLQAIFQDDGVYDFLHEHQKVLWIFGELLNAFFVAALVEELCKYFGFRALEHPDLLFITGLDRTAEQAKASGDIDSYKYESQLVSEFPRSQSDLSSVDSRGRRKRRMLRSSHDEDEDEPELRTTQQQAAAITTGMISVAVGLACAENLIYVLFLGGTADFAVADELVILLFRSFFPVHALSAAMQSINMIRKFIEDTEEGRIGIGKIIFPAVLLHGTFDAILMCANAYVGSQWNAYYESDEYLGDDYEPYNVLAVNMITAGGIIGVMVLSFSWYSHQNTLQMLRLAKLSADCVSSPYEVPEIV